jgi:hypothetical protein
MKNKITAKFFITLFVGVILLFISSSLGNKIINEPLWLILLVFFLSAIITYRLVKNFFTIDNKEKKETAVNSFFLGIIWLSIVAAVTFIFLAPIRFSMVMAASSHPKKIVACDIKAFHIKAKNKKKRLWYEFNGHANKKKITMSDYRKLAEGRNSKQYKIYLTVKESWFNTHVIKHYEIKE